MQRRSMFNPLDFSVILDEATKCLFEDCNFDVPEVPQGELF